MRVLVLELVLQQREEDEEDDDDASAGTGGADVSTGASTGASIGGITSTTDILLSIYMILSFIYVRYGSYRDIFFYVSMILVVLTSFILPDYLISNAQRFFPSHTMNIQSFTALAYPQYYYHDENENEDCKTLYIKQNVIADASNDAQKKNR